MCEQKQTPPVKVEVKNLTKKFGDLLVLDNISFDVYQGDLLCVVGPTGCGKTTFLNSLTKIYDITSGQILLDGKPVDPKTNNIAYIFQGDSTMPWLTVEQNVAFGLDIKHVPKARASVTSVRSATKSGEAMSRGRGSVLFTVRLTVVGLLVRIMIRLPR